MKTYNYLILMAGIILLFNFFGVPTASSKVLEIFNITNPGSAALSDFFLTSLAIITGISVVGIGIGLYLRTSPESFILLGYTATLFVIILDLVAIITQLRTYSNTPWIGTLVGLIFGPLIIGYVHAVLSWWGGKQ